MNKIKMQKMCQKRVDSVIDRMHELCYQKRFDDASALYSEIQDWIVQKSDIEVLSLDYLNGQI